MNRTAFSLPPRSDYRTAGGCAVPRSVPQLPGGLNRPDDLMELHGRRPGVVLSSGTTVPGRYESFDLGFADPPLLLETVGAQFTITALNKRGQVLITFLADTLHDPCIAFDARTMSKLKGHIIRGEAPVDED